MIPTPTDLAAIAAVIATPKEDPSSTARRAMELWKACEQEACRAVRESNELSEKEKEWDSYFEEDISFYRSLELSKPTEHPSLDTNDRVTLESFLKACFPNSKPNTRMAKWHAFRRSQGSSRDGSGDLSSVNEIKRLSVAAGIIRQDKEEGLPYSSDLQTTRIEFIKFFKNDCAETNANKSKKMARTRSVRSIARKVLAGEPLTSEQQNILKSLTPDEMRNEIEVLEMTGDQKMEWELTVDDMKTPKRSLPRIRKKPKS